MSRNTSTPCFSVAVHCRETDSESLGGEGARGPASGFRAWGLCPEPETLNPNTGA